MNLKNLLLYLLITVVTPSLLAAEQVFEKKSGPYTVYYSLFPSSFLKPEIAEAYGITRGKNRMVLNVSVRKALKQEEGSANSVGKSAIVRGSSSDLIHKTPLQFTEQREQGAIYYLAQIKFSGSSVLYFDLEVQPDPNVSPISIQFSKELVPE